MDAKSEIERLRTVLNQAGYEYYVMDNPTMSDYDYDHQLRRASRACDSGFSHAASRRTGAGGLSASHPPGSAGESPGCV